VDVETDLLIEQCALRALPVNFNVPGLMGWNGTDLHLHDRFRYNPMSAHHTIRFHLDAPALPAAARGHSGVPIGPVDPVPGSAGAAAVPLSLFRLHVPMHQTHLRFSVVLKREDAPVRGMRGKTTSVVYHEIEDTRDSDSMHVTLPNGQYSLTFTLDHERALPLDGTCLGFVMEVGILPLRSIHPFESLREHIPVIPECPNVPFVSETLVPYIAQLNEKHIESGSVVIKTYPIEIRYKDTFFEAELESEC
jgi:hypothetical protein